MRRVSIILFFVVFCFQYSFATIYYVSSSGNDGGDGSQGNPWRTLRHAVTRVPANQNHTIRVSAGTFVEGGAFNIPAGVNLEGAGVDQTIIKAAASFHYNPGTPGFGTDRFLINVTDSRTVDGNQSLKNFTVDGDGKRLHGGIYICNRNNVVVENVKVQYTNFCGIWFWNVRNSAARRVTIIDSSWGSTGWAAGAMMLGGIDGLELDQLNINESIGYGMKALGPSPNKITNLDMHDSRVSVAAAGKWNNGSAPNISIELWNVDLTNCEIYDSYVDNHISLVKTDFFPPGGQKSIRVHHNVIDILTRAGGGGYGMELSVNNAEVDHNYFLRGKYGIANWAEQCSNWEIHHNVFYGIQNYWPGETLRSQQSGYRNVKYYNNTIEILGPETASVISSYGGPTVNMEVKNNLIINSSSSYTHFPNKLIHLEGGATMSGLQVTNNLLQNLPVGNVAGTYASNLTTDARIAKTGARPEAYYMPVSGSPLIDAGVNVGLPYQGAAPDIGAYEFGANNNPPPNRLPAITLTAPTNNANFAAGASITLSSTATDSDGTVSKVEFFNGGTKLGEDLTSPYSFSWTNVPAGSYTLSAKATDNQGGVTTSSSVSISVTNPNTLPTVALTSPANNASFIQGVVIPLTANAADANGTITKVEFFNGNTKLGEDTSGPYAFTWNNAPVGTHSITARATDNQGGVTTSAAISVRVNGANNPPVVAITSPTANASFIAGTSITISASASDANGSINKVEFYNGNTKLGEDATSPYSFVWTNVAAGNYSLTARATDNQAATTTSATVTIRVNSANTPPVVNLSAPSNNATFTAGSAIALTANATDANGTISKVEFYNGTIKLGEDLTSPYSFSWSNVPAGTYTLTARATDNQNASTTSNVVQVTVNTPNTSVTVAITGPASNSNFDLGDPILVTANATAVSGNITKVEFFNGNTKIGEDTSGPYSFSWTNASVGTHRITARATSNQNVTSTSSGIQIVVTNPSSTLSVALISPLHQSSFTPGQSIEIEATASATSGSVTKVEFYQGNVKIGEDLTSPYSFLWNKVPAGEYELSAKATDNLSAETMSSIVTIYVIDDSHPVAIAGDDMSLTLPSGSVELIGAGESAQGLDLSYKWTQISGPGELFIADASSSTTTISDFVVGVYVLELTVTDINGSIGKDQVTITVTDSNSEILASNIPRYFTPNDDGIQDTWVWNSPEQYSNSTLTIFNQSGQIIYESYAYQNNWDGKVGGSPLQAGAYYYVIRQTDGAQDIKGAVRIIR